MQGRITITKMLTVCIHVKRLFALFCMCSIFRCWMTYEYIHIISTQHQTKDACVPADSPPRPLSRQFYPLPPSEAPTSLTLH